MTLLGVRMNFKKTKHPYKKEIIVLGRRIDVFYAKVLDIRTLPNRAIIGEGTCQSSINRYLIVKSASPYL